MILPFAQTGTPLEVVPIPGAILTRSLRATYPDSTEDQSFLHPSPYWIKYSIYFINYIMEKEKIYAMYEHFSLYREFP